MEKKLLCAGVITPRGGWMREERNGQVVYRRIGRSRMALERAINALKWVVIIGFLLGGCAQLDRVVGWVMGN